MGTTETTENVKVFIENNDVPWETTGPGMKRKIMAYDEKLMVVKVDFEKGAIGQVHQHHHVQMTHIESGVFEVEIDKSVEEVVRRKVLVRCHLSLTPPGAEGWRVYRLASSCRRAVILLGSSARRACRCGHESVDTVCIVDRCRTGRAEIECVGWPL